MKVAIKILNPGLLNQIPAYESLGAAGLDLRAAIDAPITIAPGGIALIPCGFAMAVPDGYAALLAPRSGLGHKHGLVLGNLVGVIDSDYSGEVMVSAWNRKPMGESWDAAGHNSNAYTINPWDRIAQMLIVPVARAEFEIVEELPATVRGSGGFGSSGKS